MKIDLADLEEKMESLLNRMGARFQPWEPEGGWDPIKSKEIKEKLEKDGIEIHPQDIMIWHDGRIIYAGHQVILYIRDQPVVDQSQNTSEYKFHLSYCRTLETMEQHGRINRYVVTTNTSGLFKVNLINKYTQEFNTFENLEMKVCKNCLSKLNYKKYVQSGRSMKNSIYSAFSIDEFLHSYSPTIFDNLPIYTPDNAPVNIYSSDFNSISWQFRQGKNWTCEICGINLDHPHLRCFCHSHHINGEKSDNRFVNLRCLCLACHAQQPFHERLCRTREYKAFIIRINKLTGEQ